MLWSRTACGLCTWLPSPSVKIVRSAVWGRVSAPRSVLCRGARPSSRLGTAVCTFLLGSHPLSHDFVLRVAKGVFQKVHLISSRPSLILWGFPSPCRLKWEVITLPTGHRVRPPPWPQPRRSLSSLWVLPPGPLSAPRPLGPWPSPQTV